MKDVIIAYWKEKDPEFEFDMSWLDKLLGNLRPEQVELLMTKSVDLETLQARELLLYNIKETVNDLISGNTRWSDADDTYHITGKSTMYTFPLSYSTFVELREKNKHTISDFGKTRLSVEATNEICAIFNDLDYNGRIR